MVWMEIAYLNISTSDYICGPGIDEHPNMLWFHPNDGSNQRTSELEGSKHQCSGYPFQSLKALLVPV